MHLPPLAEKWLRRSGRIAVLCGLGVLSATGAKADIGASGLGKTPERVPQQSVKSFGDLMIWTEGGRIWAAEPGSEAQELALGNTAEAQRLRLLLEQQGATAQSPHALRDRIILVGGGGDGFHWGPVPRSKGGADAHPAAASPPASAKAKTAATQR